MVRQIKNAVGFFIVLSLVWLGCAVGLVDTILELVYGGRLNCEQYSTYWFNYFIVIEVIALSIFLAYIYRVN